MFLRRQRGRAYKNTFGGGGWVRRPTCQAHPPLGCYFCILPLVWTFFGCLDYIFVCYLVMLYVTSDPLPQLRLVLDSRVPKGAPSANALRARRGTAGTFMQSITAVGGHVCHGTQCEQVTSADGGPSSNRWKPSHIMLTLHGTVVHHNCNLDVHSCIPGSDLSQRRPLWGASGPLLIKTRLSAQILATAGKGGNQHIRKKCLV